MNRLQDRDFLSGLSMVCFAALLLLVLIPNGVDEPRRVKYAALSPSYYPRIVAWVLLVVGLCVGLRAAWRPAAGEVDPDQRPDAARQISLVFVLLAAFASVLSVLGLPLASCLALLIAFPLAGERRWPRVLALAIAVPLGLYVFFLKVANIPIPLGVLQPWLGAL
ncbi:MAG: tripartite tricarboxylate transporter TctB family protein [Pseudomonadota bacterium]